jgi:hypothetical protein
VYLCVSVYRLHFSEWIGRGGVEAQAQAAQAAQAAGRAAQAKGTD